MREIKFRIWDEGNQEFEYIDFNELFNGYQKPMFINYDWLEFMQYGVKEQHTGLKDKNDNEIYEGDIVYCNKSKNNYLCVFEQGEFRFYEIYYNEKSNTFYPSRYSNSLEIIGNIHQNTELLERS